MMAPNSHHLIQISIVEEYRIFRTINLDKNDDFVYSTKNVYLYFAVGLFLNKTLLGVIFFLNKAIKVYYSTSEKKSIFNGANMVQGRNTLGYLSTRTFYIPERKYASITKCLTCSPREM